MATTKVENNYDASQIQMLRGLEAVRENMGMYLGGKDAGALHHLVYEVVDNSVDESLAGYCDTIVIEMRTDGSIAVIDNGRGIPTDIHPVEKRSALEIALTELHAGGKFKGSQGYKVSGGLHGVGVSAVNAVSEWLRAEIRRDGKLWVQDYVLGTPKAPVKAVGTAEGTGTTIIFKPDATLFTTTDFNYRTLASRFREMAYLNKSLRFKLVDHIGGREVSYYFDGGIVSFVRHLTREKGPLMPQPFYVEKAVENVNVEIALQYSSDFNENLLAFANNIANPDGGTHVTGFRTALTRTINAYGRNKGLLKEGESLSGEDVREGLTAIISVKLFRPQFESQTKAKLATPEAKTAVETVLNEALAMYLDENPTEARRMIEKSLLASRARDAARKARDLVQRKGALEGFALPGKLADCSDKEPAHCEVFLVEGDSAGGCFSGDTQVALADGRNLSFRDLVIEQQQGIEHFCYTIRRDGTIGLERIINARITKTNANVIRIYLDNDETIECTPDHKFMLHDGTYKQAQELTPDDSLMPLYRKLSDKREKGITIDGYEMVWSQRSGTWLFTHVLADWYNRWQGIYREDDGDHCHHIDFNKYNNNPTNIRRLPAAEHFALHRTHLTHTLHRPDVVEKGRQLRRTTAFRQAMSKRMQQSNTRQILSDQAKAQWDDEHYRQFMKERWRDFYNSNHEYRLQNNTRLNLAQHEYWSDESHRQLQSERVRNYFASHPEVREEFSKKAKEQWENQQLREWRSQKTREQWTPEYREKRRLALAQTYYRKTILAMKPFVLDDGSIDTAAYYEYRCQTRDKSLLSFETFCQRYFDNDAQKVCEAVRLYNHRIVAVESLSEQIDVYDLEVPHTHNFALAAGVFVHNSAKQGRDRRFQAILPLRGKILNVEKARLDKMLANNEVKALITALGTGIGETFDISRLRYHRILLMADADVDGSHIRTLLLTFFFRHMRDLITNGHLYIAQPPLFRVQHGKTYRYVYDESARDEYIKGLPSGTKVSVQRFKGLGEMNPEQLWDTTLNPGNRMLLQVTIEDAMQADETFTMLMGDLVPPRKKFIQTHAADVKNLDV